MRVACLQLAPRLGAIEDNVAGAERLVGSLVPGNVDLLVLPEMAFSGYNFPSLQAIQSFLEPTAAGLSTAWAHTTATRLNCIVIIGYPEISTPESEQRLPPRFRRHDTAEATTAKRFNSTVTVSPAGEILAHYRKSFLYYTDETWASEGPGFFAGELPLSLGSRASSSARDRGSEEVPRAGTKTAMGICMDINNYRFTAPWTAYEFANHVISSQASLVVLSNAWLSHELTPEDLTGESGKRPDLHTLSYWIERLRPVMEGEKEVVCVIANRTGIEPGGEGQAEARYAGTSCVLVAGRGVVRLWGILGMGREGLLRVDTDEEPRYVLSSTQESDV